MPTRRASAHTPADEPHAKVVDLDRYVPAYLTWIANKLSRGASQYYLNAFGVGIESFLGPTGSSAQAADAASMSASGQRPARDAKENMTRSL